MRISIHAKPGLVVAGLAVAVSATACSVGATGASNPFTDRPTTEELEDGPRLPNEIAQSEIVRRGKTDHTAMALVRRLRPAWLRARGQKSFKDESAMYPVVYIDEIRRGGLSTLHQIPSSEIQSMQFISTVDATTRWGTGHPSGVINVITGR